MADKTVKITLKVSSDGSAAEELKTAKQIESTYTRINKEAGTTGSRAVAAKATPNMSGTAYGASRGVAGTGASARDFANEAQGLGGLVRLYATVAANAFAASAAFSLLKNAMDTTNMVKGLDQLGASSGIALGSLAKQLAAASDGAISLKDAMTATAQATSAGISGKELKELGIIARNASQALGRDMGDSLSRLTRSVTKLEPELIDELGLFTKIGPATEAYARSLNKTVSSLSAVEKQQAFLNSVLKEGRDKYSEIDIPANPYQQLQASLTNLTQVGLEFINRFLTPLASVLANNTTLLATVMGALGIKVLGMAVPAFTSWRNELTKSAQTAKDKARDINESFGEKFVQRTNAAFKIPELEKNLKDAEVRYAASRQKFVDIDNNYKRKGQSKVFGDVSQNKVDGDTIKRIQTEITVKTKEGGDANLKHVAGLERIKAAYIEILSARKALTTAEDAALIKADKMSAEDWARAKISKRAGSKADSLGIVSQVGSNVESGGFGYAMDTMRAQIKRSTDMGPWTKFSTNVKGTLAGITTQVGIFGSALQGALGWIGLIAAATTMIVSIFSRASDEVSALTSSLDLMGESIKVADASYMKFKDTVTTGSLIARGNSLTELGDQLVGLVDKITAIEEKAGWADRLSDSVATVLGGGIRKSLGDKIGGNIVAQLNQIPAGPLKQAAENKIRSILNITGDITKESVGSVIRWSEDAGAITDAISKIDKVLKPTQQNAKALSGSAQSLASALTSAGTASQTLLMSLQSSDPLVKYGESLIVLGSGFKVSTGNAEGLLAALKELELKPDAIKLMSPEQYTQMLKFGENLPGIVKTLDTYQTKLSELENTKLGFDKAIASPNIAQSILSSLISERDRVAEEIGKTKLIIRLNKEAFNEIQTAINNLSNKTILEGYKMISAQVTAAVRLAATAFQKSILGGISGPGISQANAKLELDSLAVQRQQISATEKLNETLILSNVISSKRAAQESSATIASDILKTGGVKTEAQEALLKENASILMSSDLLIGAISTGKNLGNAAITGLDQGSQASYTQIQSLRAGKGVALAANKGQADTVKAQAKYGAAKEEADVAAKLLSTRTKTAQLEESIFGLQVQALPYLNDAQLAQQKSLQDSVKTKQNLEEINTIEAAIKDLKLRQEDADSTTLPALSRVVIEKGKELIAAKDRQTVEASIAEIQSRQLGIAEKAKAAGMSTDIKSKAQDQEFAGAEAFLQNKIELLGIEAQLGKYSGDELATKEKALKLDSIALEQERSLILAKRTLLTTNADIQTKIDQAKAADPNANTLALDQQKVAIQTFYDNEVKLINRSTEAKINSVELTYSMTDRMKGFSKIVEDSFANMGDALAEFAKTGKLDFGGLVTSMIMDLARFELRAQMSALYNSFGGFSGIMGMLTGSSAPVAISDTPMLESLTMQAAQGRAFDAGIQKFALGGSFTNSIVNSPTLFKFAKGTGMMGEAGPEAIMPLKRDSQGNLGVRAGGTGGEVFVVVNNYSTSEAQTKETTDSNGNRRIEVTIADIVAKEVGRANSSINSGMKANFNIQPNLVRR